MNTQQLIDYIRNAEKKTPVQVILWASRPMTFPERQVLDCGKNQYVLWGDWTVLSDILEKNRNFIQDIRISCAARNSALPLLDIRHLNARIEPGAILREGVEIGENAVVMMGAILNVGAVVGPGTMVDMGAVLGGRAQVGARCHIGAGAVLAGVLEPASATPVVVGDGVLIGANAVVLEGCRVGSGAVVAAGAVVTGDVPENAVVAGCPARLVKFRDANTDAKTAIVEALRG